MFDLFDIEPDLFVSRVSQRHNMSTCPAILRFRQALVVIRREVLFDLPDCLLDDVEIVH